jgi:hypothetical protein
VPDAGRRVVLGARRDTKRPAARCRPQRGRQATYAAFDIEPRRREYLGTPQAGSFLSERELRVGVNTLAQLNKRGAVSLDPAGRGPLDRRRGHLHLLHTCHGQAAAAAMIGNSSPGPPGALFHGIATSGQRCGG